MLFTQSSRLALQYGSDTAGHTPSSNDENARRYAHALAGCGARPGTQVVPIRQALLRNTTGERLHAHTGN